MPNRLRTLFRGLMITVAVIMILCGVLLGAFQVIVGRVPEYRVQLQEWIGERTGLVIEFSKLSARLRAYGPELVFHDAVVRTPDRAIVLASARRGSVGFDLWTSMSTGRLTAGRFSLDSPEIGLIRTREGRIELVGQSALPDRDTESFAVEKLPVGRFRVSDAVVSFRDEATGRGPWALSGVSFNLDRQPHLLELQGDAALPASLGQSLEFSARAEGALEASHAVVATFRIQGDQLDLAGWADVLPDEWPAPETGRGKLLLTGTLRGTQLDSVTAKVDFRKIAAVAPVWTVELPRADPLIVKTDAEDDSASARAPAQATVPRHASPRMTTAEMLSYEHIAFTAAAKRVENGWTAKVTDLDVARGKENWRAAELQTRWARNEAGELSLSAKADRVSLQSLWPLLAYLPESETLAHLRALRMKGAVENVSFEMQRVADQPPRYTAQAELDGIGLAPVLRSPGITGVTGRVKATQDGGELQVDSDNLQFDLPRMFRGPLQIQALQGAVKWQRDSAAWTVKSDGLRVRSKDGNVVANLALTLPPEGASPMLELQATAQDLNTAATATYLPADKLSPKALEWLGHAFPEGRVSAAQVTFSGPTHAFPFRGGEGEFKVIADVENMTFVYQPGWQPATGMRAEVEFHNEGMRLRSGSATLGGLRLASMSGEFADFRKGIISVNAVAAGDLEHALQFLKDSPVGPTLGDTFQKLHGQGVSQSRVSLWLPLKRINDRRLTVNTQLKDTTVTLDGVDAPITQLSGSLRIRQSLPDKAELQGRWLDGPVSIGIASEEKSNRATLTARGEASADELSAMLNLPGAVKIGGVMQWRLLSALVSAPNTRLTSKFTIDSNLQGLGIDLPYPAGKTLDQARRLHLELEYPQDDVMILRSSLGDIRALVRLRHATAGWSLDRGGLRADAVPASLPDHRGIRIEGTLDRLKLDDWLNLRGSGSSTAASGSSSSAGSRLSDYLHALSVRVGTLQLYGYQWQEVRSIVQATRSGWQVDVAGPNAAGSLMIPEDFGGPQPLTASLERFIVTSIPKDESKPKDSDKNKPSDPRTWPALRVFIANLAVDKHTIGTVDLRTSKVPAGIKVDSLTLVQDALQGTASGQWLMTSEGERSSLNAKVASTDVAATLRALNYTQFLDAKRGEIMADLSWPGGFDGDILSHASGTLTVNAENGQLLNVQPGAGRVLGLLSVAALPRRLSLDFSDLTDKGLSFDSVHGDFQLRNGDAFTTNLLLRGPAAEIGIAGRTGLGAHDYDQTAVVTGNLGATLPVAGALAGGPAVGAALLLFSRVFKEPLKGIARGYYRITGSWDEPVVERVDAAEVREASATQTSPSGT